MTAATRRRTPVAFIVLVLLLVVMTGSLAVALVARLPACPPRSRASRPRAATRSRRA